MKTVGLLTFLLIKIEYIEYFFEIRYFGTDTLRRADTNLPKNVVEQNYTKALFIA